MSRTRRYLDQLSILCLVQLRNWRWTWKPMLVMGIATPALIMFALAALSGDRGGDDAVHIAGGAITLTLMFQNTNRVAQNFAYMKAMGTLDLFRTMPVSLNALTYATVTSFFFLSLPGVVATLLVARLFLDVDVRPGLVAVPVLLLAAWALAGLGAAIGALCRSPETSSSVSLATSMALLFLGPVYIPADRLPDWLTALSHASPSTYASSAVRAAFFGQPTDGLWLDLVVLLVFGIAFSALSRRVLASAR
ncbi:ABC transporter permease [Actinosynnema sp. NPDC023587]|uniref:ABC transporter permease n=1 Tax=Actinosynnema sp. NPDC023587 TaxID=3154695 RepID=UPI0034098E87